jgi:hypothetical protein
MRPNVKNRYALEELWAINQPTAENAAVNNTEHNVERQDAWRIRG